MIAQIQSPKRRIALGAAIRYGIGGRLGLGRRNLSPKSFLDRIYRINMIKPESWNSC